MCVVVSARVLFVPSLWRDNTRGQRRGHAIKDNKPKRQPSTVHVAKVVRKKEADVEKLAQGLLELIKQLSQEDGLNENWRSKPKE